MLFRSFLVVSLHFETEKRLLNLSGVFEVGRSEERRVGKECSEPWLFTLFKTGFVQVLGVFGHLV